MKYILGNWKQQGDLKLLHEMAAVLKLLKYTEDQFIGIFPPFVYLQEAHQLLLGSSIQLGAQNVSACEKGALTGEVSARMLKEIGCTMVLVGHSERRQFFSETDNIIEQKLKQIFNVDLIPVLCVGETLEEYQAGKTQEVVQKQLKVLTWVKDVHPQANFMIAYEPVWAIGTGKTATKDQAQTVHQSIRSILAKMFSPEMAKRIPILYGGSVNSKNAPELLSMPDIQGLLVGGASIVPEQFGEIIKDTV